VEDVEPGTILTRSFFSDLHGQDSNEDHTTSDLENEPGTLNNQLRLPHISYKTSQELPLINSFTDPDYFTAAFTTLFPCGIGGHLGDSNGDRPEEISLKAFAKYATLHHSLL
jgi:hypothetical protein